MPVEPWEDDAVGGEEQALVFALLGLLFALEAWDVEDCVPEVAALGLRLGWDEAWEGGDWAPVDVLDV